MSLIMMPGGDGILHHQAEYTESRRRAGWHSRQEDDGDRTRHGHHPTKATPLNHPSTSARDCVCVYNCRTYYKAVRGGGRRRVDDMCYDRRRAEACVDESARHALGPVRNPVLLHRVRLFSLVPLVWESNPKLQGGWCKTQPPGR